MGIDRFHGLPSGTLDGPFTNGADVTPDDGFDLPIYARSLWVGTGGTLVVTLRGDLTPVTLYNVPAGLHKLYAKRVWATGTTAASIVALW